MEHSIRALFLHGYILLSVMFAPSEGAFESLWPAIEPKDPWWYWWDTFMESFRHSKLSIETLQEHIITFDAPGMDIKSVKIEVLIHKWELHLSMERKKEGEKGHNQRYAERSHGKFIRKLKLPKNVDVKSFKSGLVNGVLSVFISKQFHDGIKSHKVNIDGNIVKHGSREEL
ncbi:hypothetical protein Leryth_023736 [Lithospermum erythrorhizon]|uniref:SHSP domain-containing protein n=1 Tax=Lithospermum erythrorhizon TaxID=34254 RepID=A0AAV3RXX8_LITER|nr:hypothetical protein Leryth_023736 [Lithospermum erythrorhizon]